MNRNRPIRRAFDAEASGMPNTRRRRQVIVHQKACPFVACRLPRAVSLAQELEESKVKRGLDREGQLAKNKEVLVQVQLGSMSASLPIAANVRYY
jgi:hypothetical protein